MSAVTGRRPPRGATAEIVLRPPFHLRQTFARTTAAGARAWERRLVAPLHELRAQALLALEREWDAVVAAETAVALARRDDADGGDAARAECGGEVDALQTLGRACLNLGEPSLALERQNSGSARSFWRLTVTAFGLSRAH